MDKPSHADLDSLLNHEDRQSFDSLEAHWHRQEAKQRRSTMFLTGIIAFLMACLISSNVFWYRRQPFSAPACGQTYFGEDTMLLPFSHDWRGLEEHENATHHYADESWDELFPIGSGVVQLDMNFVEEWNLDPSSYSDFNSSEMVYYIAGYHQLHCLEVVRKTIYQLNNTIPILEDDPLIWDHVLHCLEAVRKGVTCNLDSTLMYVSGVWPQIVDGQMHVCRNRPALHRWAEEHSGLMPGEHETMPDWYLKRLDEQGRS